MKHFSGVVQGSQEWLRLRMGKATASEFSRLITPKKWEQTKGETRRNYQIYLLTELILDMPLSSVSTVAMNHGTAAEENARAAYEMLIGQEVEMCGFCTNDEMTYGASPDAFVGEEGICELKSPWKPEIHVGYLMDNQSFVDEYFVQVQGELCVTERKWADLASYFATLPTVIVRVEPHPEFQEKLKLALRSFCAEFSDLVERAVNLGYLKETPPATDWIQAGDADEVRRQKQQRDWLALTDEDIERIWASTRGSVAQ